MANLVKTTFILWAVVQISIGVNAQVDHSRLIQDLTILANDSMEGRKTGTSGNEKARAYILDRLKEIGIKPYKSDFEIPFNFKSEEIDHLGKNIVAIIPGSESSKGNIVISAHYDHVGIKSEEIYNGADDNASGVAALFSISEHYKIHKPQHNLIIAFFDAEESGLKGAHAFVDSNHENIILNINMDMISRSATNEIYIAGTYQNPQLKSWIEPVLQKDSILNVLFGHDNPGTGGHDWTNSSDHAPFHKAGIPFLYFGVEDHDDYHRPSDDPEKINATFYSAVVEMIIRVVGSMDTSLP